MLAVSQPVRMALSAILHLRKTLDVCCVLKECLMERMTMPGMYYRVNYRFFHHGGRKLVRHLKTRSKSKTPMEQATSSLAETLLSSVSLRINEPYWLLHRGNCEHFVVIEQIRCIDCHWEKSASSTESRAFRAIHPSDPRTGYPILLQHTPQLLDICRACSKSPAVWSIVNDIRLGESPSCLCAVCWENMGLPEDSELGSIEVIPLLHYIP